jgi:hypothetical protein
MTRQAVKYGAALSRFPRTTLLHPSAHRYTTWLRHGQAKVLMLYLSGIIQIPIRLLFGTEQTEEI